MTLKKLLITLFIVYLAAATFTEIDKLTEAQTLKLKQLNSNTGNPFEVSHFNLFDLTTYNDKGDWAVIIYGEIEKYTSVKFYDIDGNFKSQFDIPRSQKQEGKYGVSICNTNLDDEVFISFSQKTLNGKHIIVGGIIDDMGNRRRGDNWIKIFSDESSSTTESLGYHKPSITVAGEYLYAMAYANNDKFLEFKLENSLGGVSNNLRNLAVAIPQSDPENLSNIGNPAFNVINIAGSASLLDSDNLKGTIFTHREADKTNLTFLSYFHNFEIISLEGSKAVGIYIDPINVMPGGTNINDEYFYIQYVYINDGEIEDTVQRLDNTSATYPNKEEFLQLKHFSADRVVGTNYFTISYTLYTNQDQRVLFISTIDSSDNSIICHETTILGPQYEDFFGTNYMNNVRIQNPQTTQFSATEAYISLYAYMQKFNNDASIILKYNPSTCTVNNQEDPIFSVQKYFESDKLSKIQLVQNRETNKIGIANISIDGDDSKLYGTLIQLKTMLNCETTDDVNNVCLTCIEGYYLNDDSQCLIPHCGLKCSKFNMFCDFKSNLCVECELSSHCSGNSNGFICHNNTCQDKCYNYNECSSLNKVCDLETNLCVSSISITNVKTLSEKSGSKVQVVEANNPNSGQLEIDFEISDEEEKKYSLEFLKIEMGGEVVYPLEVNSDIKGKISVMLPRNTKNGVSELKMYANQLIPKKDIQQQQSSGQNRRFLQKDFQNTPITMTKTVRVVDSMEQYSQEQDLLNAHQSREISEKETQYEDENSSKNTVVGVLVPLMIVGYIGFLVGGFLAGKKMGQLNQKDKNQKTGYNDPAKQSPKVVSSPLQTEKAN